MVIWITGLSGSGKTTLCRALRDLLKQNLPELVLLDGDVIRAIFGADLGYREEDRSVQIRRLQGLAKVLSEQDQVVIVAALYAHPDLLDWNRNNFDEYFEIYLKAPLELVQGRDAKGLYAAAAAGDTADVVGIDIPWHEPFCPDMVIDAAGGKTPTDLAKRVAAAIPLFSSVLKKTAP